MKTNKKKNQNEKQKCLFQENKEKRILKENDRKENEE